jgi:hypothetical protein
MMHLVFVPLMWHAGTVLPTQTNVNVPRARSAAKAGEIDNH